MQAALQLQSIELQTKQAAYTGSKKLPPPSLKIVFLTTFLLTPCLFMEALFVPLLGLILVSAVLWTGIAYIRLVGSYRCYLAATIGVVSALIIICLSSDVIKRYGDFAMYVILGLGTGSSLACWLWFTGAKLLRLERGLALMEKEHL